MRGPLSRFNWRVAFVQFLANTIVIGLLLRAPLREPGNLTAGG
jgi:hypothetical protein